MPKQIKIAMPQTKTQDQWVREGKDNNKSLEKISAEKMKRLTIDISEALHSQIKIFCAKKGVKMADELRQIISEHFTE